MRNELFSDALLLLNKDSISNPKWTLRNSLLLQQIARYQLYNHFCTAKLFRKSFTVYTMERRL